MPHGAPADQPGMASGAPHAATHTAVSGPGARRRRVRLSRRGPALGVCVGAGQRSRPGGLAGLLPDAALPRADRPGDLPGATLALPVRRHDLRDGWCHQRADPGRRDLVGHPPDRDWLSDLLRITPEARDRPPGWGMDRDAPDRAAGRCPHPAWPRFDQHVLCLLYTSDAADDLL